MSPVLLRQYDQMSMQATHYGDKIRAVKAEVLEVNRLIGRLQSEIEAVKSQVVKQRRKVRSISGRLISVLSQRGNLENQLTEAEERGELAIKEAKARARDLEEALQRAKQDMARQLREYQVSMSRGRVRKRRNFIPSSEVGK